MKQGILITAYKNYDHLIDIVDFFNDDSFEVFIHIDRKSKTSKETIEKLYAFNCVKFVSTKYKVNWGGLNHLKCILFLAKEAVKNKELEYIHSITGHDYPIKSKSYFIDFFKRNNGKDFLDYFEMMPDNHSWMNRLIYFNLYDVFDGKKSREKIENIVKFQLDYNIIRGFTNKIPKLYGGSTYWSLTRETLKYVVDYTKENKHLINRLKHTFCAEEIYFQTVIMNSRFSKNIINDNMRYIDWEMRNGNAPANLDMTDLEILISSDKLFARKFEVPVSNELRLILSISNKTSNIIQSYIN